MAHLRQVAKLEDRPKRPVQGPGPGGSDREGPKNSLDTNRL